VYDPESEFTTQEKDVAHDVKYYFGGEEYDLTDVTVFIERTNYSE
jgi:hypothetical protein